MMIMTDIKYIVRDPAILAGVPIIEGHRIAVHHIVWWYQQGHSVEQIAQNFSLSLSQVHAALLYYYEHQSEIDREIEENAASFAQYDEKAESSITQRMKVLMHARISSEI